MLGKQVAGTIVITLSFAKISEIVSVEVGVLQARTTHVLTALNSCWKCRQGVAGSMVGLVEQC